MIPQTLIQFIDSPVSTYLFFTLISLLFSTSKHASTKLFAQRIVDTATRLMTIGAVLLLGIYTYQFLEAMFTINNLTVTGPYWFALWYYPLVLLLVQLFWFKKLRKIVGLRLLAGVLLLISPKLIEKVMIIITLRERDYVISGWSLNNYWPIWLGLINAIIITTFEIALWMYAERLLSRKSGYSKN